VLMAARLWMVIRQITRDALPSSPLNSILGIRGVSGDFVSPGLLTLLPFKVPVAIFAEMDIGLAIAHAL